MSEFDPYKVLGIERDVDEKAVKAAYRETVKRTHPDKGGDRSAYEEAVRAYRILLDAEQRRRFDETGAADPQSKENIHAGAVSVIIAVVQDILKQLDEQNADMNELAHGFIWELRTRIGANVTHIRALQNPLRKQVAQLERVAKRLKRKPDASGDSFVHDALQFTIRQKQRSLESLEDQIDVYDEALVILRDYEFVSDAMQQIASYGRRPGQDFTSFIA